MLDDNTLIWLLLGAIFIIAALWHIFENRRFARKWRGDLDAVSAERLVRFAWGRTAQLLYTIACAIAVIVVYDWQLSKARHELEAERDKSPTVIVTAPVQPTPPPATQTEVIPKPPPVIVQPQQPNPTPTPTHVAAAPENYYPPVIKGIAPPKPAPAQITPTVGSQAQVRPQPQSTPQAQVNLPAPTTATEATDIPPSEGDVSESAIGAVGPQDQNQSTSETVDEIYNPEKTTGGNEAAMDGIKKRYEDILVIYMFLKKCGMTGANDYLVITSSLGQEMASVNAPGRMQADIISSAQGSYKEMYSKSNCNDPSVVTLQTQYRDYLKALSDNLAAQQQQR